MLNPIQAIQDIRARRAEERRQSDMDEIITDAIEQNLEFCGNDFIDWVYAYVNVIPDTSPVVFVRLQMSAQAGNNALAVSAPFVNKEGVRAPEFFFNFPDFASVIPSDFEQAAQSIVCELVELLMTSMDFEEQVEVSESGMAASEIVSILRGRFDAKYAMSCPYTSMANPALGAYEMVLGSSDDGYDYVLTVNLVSYRYFECEQYGNIIPGGAWYVRGIPIAISAMQGGVNREYVSSVNVWGLWEHMSDEALIDIGLNALFDAMGC